MAKAVDGTTPAEEYEIEIFFVRTHHTGQSAYATICSGKRSRLRNHAPPFLRAGEAPIHRTCLDAGQRKDVVEIKPLALQMAAPFLVYGIVLVVGMGLIARLMPTLQVFFVVMPLQLLVGFGLMAVTISAAMIWFLDVYRDHLVGFTE